ncbi:MAG: asparagine synthase (glutamine-hydrolyzing) [Ferruginibacter sp.]
MCRIAGAINNPSAITTTTSTVKEMCGVLKHGGPDDEGIYVNEASGLVLGHRRLSVIDLSANGHQPMCYLSRYVISYNGELYNYPELKQELTLLGYHFKTETDTEVILAAYSAWGTKSFTRFIGMFALAIWDDTEQVLLLARDASGIKPLYYMLTEEGITFASEIKAFHCFDNLPEQNRNWPVFLMAYGHLPEPVTIYKNVKPLEKGSCLVYNYKSRSVKTDHFYYFNIIEKITEKDTAVKLIQEQLDMAVKRHLISNAPIGVFLSGGLDSSIIAKLANNHVDNLNTLSIYFEKSEYSEKKFQDILKNELSCTHNQHLLTENEFHAFLPAVINAMDLPCGDGINTWFISKYAKEAGLKVVLSGLGADELFGGYPSFDRIRTALLLQKMPGSLLKSLRITNTKKLRRLAYLSLPGAAGRYLFLRGQFVPSQIARHLDASEHEIWQILEHEPVLPYIDYLTPENQVSWMETNMYMQNQLLRDADTMGMAHGVEIRVPFLDTAFLKLAFKISSAVKYDGHHSKQLLIDSFAGMLPESIWKRPKMGFSFPFREWLSNERYAAEVDSSSEKDAHAKLISGQMHWSQFFTLLLLKQYRYGKG